MARQRPEPVQVVKTRRDGVLAALTGSIPYAQFLGVTFERRGDELTAVLNYSDDLIGNPLLPAIHGGVTAAFLEIAATVSLTWATIWDDVESGAIDATSLPRLPKTIDFTIDYLRSGLPRDAYARARITRSGRRYASVQVEAWQDNRARPFAQGLGHFVMPRKPEASGV
ncbi:PaaI family thioesterase [Shimia ponticola]|uniref:PaaI family thioesterase n=1 Tax=Shimia ponticola TaxID=2582893 RepID=UPI0011BF09E2|nr:PaaI family thioesterase [Shimia ponticola]